MRINHMRKNSVYKDPLVDDLNEKMEEYIKKLNYQPINDQLAEGILIWYLNFDNRKFTRTYKE